MKTSIIIPVAIANLFLSVPVFAAVTFTEGQGQAFGGEKCIRCHSDKPTIQAQDPSESFDVVIVGGGMAGLSTLHYLQDVNAVVLETQDRVGGQMLYNTWQGVRYAEGAAYMVEPYGILGEFYRTEKIPLIKIPEPDNLRDDYAGRTDALREQQQSVFKDLTRRDLKLIPPPGLTPQESNKWMAVKPTFAEVEIEGKKNDIL